MTRPRLLVPAIAILALAATAAKDPFQVPLPAEVKIAHGLERLTFGARPGDVEAVRKLGWKRWLDQQLHPEKIQESAALEAKLKPLDAIAMPQAELISRYPPPQMIRAVAEGRAPMPRDPQTKAMMERLVERYKTRQAGAEAEPPMEAREPRIPLTDVVSKEELRVLRNGSDDEKKALLASLDESRFEKLAEAAPRGMRAQLLAHAAPEQRRRLMAVNAPQQVIGAQLTEAKLYRAIYSERQLLEVMSDFWYNHFNVFLDKGADRFLVPAYERDAIRPHALGKFRDLLQATAQHPAMLFYLDNWQSVSADFGKRAERMMARRGQLNANGKVPKAPVRGLNENYARELMELHTLGVDGGYTQKDVTEVARCFTGWTIRDPRTDGTFFYDDRRHDKGEKVVLGVTIPAGGGKEDAEKVLDILARHPSTAKFVARKLAQRFVADQPPPALVERMAKTFRESDGDIPAVLKAMIDSPEFFSQGAHRAKIKTPLEMIASAVRSTGAEVSFAAPLGQQLAQLGQPLYRKQEPTGYSSLAADWVNSAALLSRMNFALALAQNRIPGVKVDPSRFGSEADPKAIGRLLTGRDISEQTQAAIQAKMAEQKDVTPALVAGLVMGSPEFQRR
ncbi:MAG: DUF1800 domain-containing protein [Bryobacteraceae bacterium]|nr:DUF1800 domain-containing protein [Bryobacteraceae bacterium]